MPRPIPLVPPVIRAIFFVVGALRMVRLPKMSDTVSCRRCVGHTGPLRGRDSRPTCLILRTGLCVSAERSPIRWDDGTGSAESDPDVENRHSDTAVPELYPVWSG